MTFSLKTWLGRFWANLSSNPEPPPSQGRPKSIADLCQRFAKTDQSYAAFTRLWGEWLSEFYANPTAASICMPPDVWMPRPYAALIAGTVDYLVNRNQHPVPYWINDCAYILGDDEPPFVPALEECHVPDSQSREKLIEIIRNQTPRAMLRHGVLIRAKALERGVPYVPPPAPEDP